MTSKSPHKRAKRSLPARQDGAATRSQLLEAAGEIFADHGHAKATSKEICERAQANIAAVNYHFGGKDELYAAVLEEAHARLMSLESVAAAAQSRVDPQIKLRMLLGHIVAEIAQRDRSRWELRVLSRELLSQSPLMERLISNQIAPKAKLVHAILAEIMELPVEHPAVSRSALNVMGPFILMLIASRPLLQKVAPNLNPNADELTDHMITYAVGGMKAVARKSKK